MANIEQQRKNAKEFVDRWINRGSERSDAQSFWIDLFQSLLGVKNATNSFEFEKKVPLKTNKGDVTNDFIDAYVKDTHVVIEQKGSSKSLIKKYKQSDGSELTPFQQAKKYYENIPYDQRGQFIVTSNFKEIRIYDLNKTLPEDHPQIVKLEDLAKEPNVLNFLTDVEQDRIFKEKKVSIDAGDLVAKIYDELLKQYPDPDSVETQKSINQLCVRIVFCLYAEDAGIFGAKNAFHDYLVQFKASETRDALNRLFEVLNTKEEDRKRGDVYYAIQEHESLGQFPYVNGGMFAGKVDIPNFTDELRTLVLRDASDNFDWSQISPAIFGAVFESTLNADERRKNGMHYTSIENIHKVIDPLFLNDLKQELKAIEETTSYIRKKHLAEKFQIKLSKLKFLDPACGSGNFLTETYLSLRRLENEAIKIQHPNPMLDVGQASDYIKVSIQQFYGIELNDFAVSVAKTAMWIAECQMFEKTKDIIYAQGDFLPLKTYVHIHEGDALKMDWNDVVDKQELSYIIGNPPFNGARTMSKEQKADLVALVPKLKGIKNLDFVAGWYIKASDYMKNADIQCVFVSTSSIVQGEQPDILWRYILKKQNMHINFAYRPFEWNSEAKSQAAVWVIIICFSYSNDSNKLLFNNNNQIDHVNNINAYLFNASDVILTSRSVALNAPHRIVFGSMPNDHGFLVVDSATFKGLKKKNNFALQFIKPFIGGSELLKGKERYCLWLVDATPSDIQNSSFILDRVKSVQQYRLQSKRSGTRHMAQEPALFAENRQPDADYIAIPKVSTSARRYIPMGFVNKNTIASDLLLIVPNAGLFDFGVLESLVHMIWTRVVAGRLGDGYRYSAKLVYNNFPWSTPTPEQKQKIEQAAQAILDVRKKYPDSSLADLYDPLTMPSDLRKAHEENDKAVLSAYGLSSKATESEIVAHLFKMYEELTKKDD